MKGAWSRIFAEPRRARRFVVAVCFAAGLLVGWLAADYWFDRFAG
ncbi:hypothetical protein [uncultured Alistipes sp.]|nr:hypothetical protein [uncultured Alistipes sp.]